MLYDPTQEGSDADWEWIEIYNPASQTVLLSGWRIGDNTSQDALPQTSLSSQVLTGVVAAKDAAFRANHPGFATLLVSLEGNIGNGLSNTGDAVPLDCPG